MTESGAALGVSPLSQQVSRHRLYEDIVAILLGTMLVSVGLVLYAKALLVTGSLAGTALIIHYATGATFGTVFFVINLPFYVLAFVRMGWRFATKTIISVMLVSVFSALIPQWLVIDTINPWFASLAGGGMVGLGILALFRHRSSVGGINLLALYLQENNGIRAGYFQLGVDILVLMVAFFVVPWDRVLISMLGAATVNLVVAMNHKPGRYVGFS